MGTCMDQGCPRGAIAGMALDHLGGLQRGHRGSLIDELKRSASLVYGTQLDKQDFRTRTALRHVRMNMQSLACRIPRSLNWQTIVSPCPAFDRFLLCDLVSLIVNFTHSGTSSKKTCWPSFWTSGLMNGVQQCWGSLVMCAHRGMLLMSSFWRAGVRRVVQSTKRLLLGCCGPVRHFTLILIKLRCMHR